MQVCEAAPPIPDARALQLQVVDGCHARDARRKRFKTERHDRSHDRVQNLHSCLVPGGKRDHQFDPREQAPELREARQAGDAGRVRRVEPDGARGLTGIGPRGRRVLEDPLGDLQQSPPLRVAAPAVPHEEGRQQGLAFLPFVPPMRDDAAVVLQNPHRTAALLPHVGFAQRVGGPNDQPLTRRLLGQLRCQCRPPCLSAGFPSRRAHQRRGDGRLRLREPRRRHATGEAQGAEGFGGEEGAEASLRDQGRHLLGGHGHAAGLRRPPQGLHEGLVDARSHHGFEGGIQTAVPVEGVQGDDDVDAGRLGTAPPIVRSCRVLAELRAQEPDGAGPHPAEQGGLQGR
mmetsp:Transcript_163400/g.523952  ORF Transcript_163400/g.523952 Transcript_163400/m.523952 type:complete len:344 (-) Transcript_163400:1184-2215(-)